MKFTLHRICFIFMNMFALAISNNCYAQRMGIATNLLGWGTLSPNVGAEIGLSYKSTIAGDISFAPWKISSNLSLRHIWFSTEYRYWFKQSLHGHFLGINLAYSAYDIRHKSNSCKGNMLGAGIGYGYSFVLSPRFNLVPHIGLGIAWNKKREQEEQEKLIPTITKAGISLQYIIR